MATKFLTAKFGPDLLRYLRSRGPVPTTTPTVRDAVDDLNYRWPDSPGDVGAWVARIRIALLLEAYDAHADAPAHRRVSAAVETEIKRRKLHQAPFAKRVGLSNSRLSQLLNCYVRWTHEEVATVAKTLRLALALPAEQWALALAPQPARSISDHGLALERIAHLEAALAEARELHQAAAVARDLERERLQRARAAISECRNELIGVVAQEDRLDHRTIVDTVRRALLALKGEP